jgi:hypothetical protein
MPLAFLLLAKRATRCIMFEEELVAIFAVVFTTIGLVLW